ncbi:MAG: hypothetical protein JJU13_05885 [Balneolaceae bacterium]|nr:hypothetical protein [Balneolaceae bacterium]
MYIIDYKKQNQLINDMLQVRRDLDNCVVFFHHILTDQMWKSFFPRAAGKELGPKLLRHEPVPESLAQHITICLTEQVPENAIGLGIEFSAQIEQWPEIIRILEENRKTFKSKQIKLFLKHLQINQFSDNISQLGISQEDLVLTDQDLKQLRRRTWKLRLKSSLI